VCVHVCVSRGDTLLFDMVQLLQYDVRLHVNSKYVQLSLCKPQRSIHYFKNKKLFIFSPVDAAAQRGP